MNDRLSRIRESEKKSHTAAYTGERLYHGDSWLQKPIKTVRELLPLFSGYQELRVLDLGCGIGRNSICIAEVYHHINCTIDCVDLLEIAIEKLNQNAEAHQVKEHIDSEKSFVGKLWEIKSGVRENGIVCLVINSGVRERNVETNEPMEAQFEVNLPTEKLQSLLADIFSGWHILKTGVTAQEYNIPREEKVSHLDTNVVTYVAQKCKP